MNWALLLFRSHCNGVLADEMGLGKTIQVACLFAMLVKEMGEHGPHLVVTPASTVDNWVRELGKWCPTLNVVKYGGTKDARAEFLDRDRFPRGTNVVVTTYTYFSRNDCKQDRKFLSRQGWTYLVLDEAHGIKDSTGGRFQQLLKVSAEYKLLLTGTPIQNNLMELFTILRFTMPTVFQSSDVMLFQACATGEATVQASTERLTYFRRLLEPFILRRRKVDVLGDLPPKLEVFERLALTPGQLETYRDVALKGISTKETRAAAVKADAVVLTRSSVPDKVPKVPQRIVKHLYTELRKAANHPLLLRRLYAESDSRFLEICQRVHDLEVFGSRCTLAQVMKELSNTSDFEIHRICEEHRSLAPYRLSEEQLFDSGKMRVLRELLPRLAAEGHRILLFSQWTQVLDLLEVFLARCVKMEYLRLDGSTAVADRQPIIDNFTLDLSIPVMIISTRAGGLGLNITSADTVIMHDMDFNPHVDRQAEDRVHRMGQTRPVTVYRLVAENTIDDALVAMQADKSRLNDALLLKKGGTDGEETGAQAETTVAPSVMAELLHSALSMLRGMEVVQGASKSKE